MKKRGRLMLLAAAALLATAGVAAVAGARSLARDPAGSGSSADATATERARQGKVRASTPALVDARLPEEPPVPHASKPDPWDHFNPYERWVRNVPFERTHVVR